VTVMYLLWGLALTTLLTLLSRLYCAIMNYLQYKKEYREFKELLDFTITRLDLDGDYREPENDDNY
jgi:hypothetical protein